MSFCNSCGYIKNETTGACSRSGCYNYVDPEKWRMWAEEERTVSEKKKLGKQVDPESVRNKGYKIVDELVCKIEEGEGHTRRIHEYLLKEILG